jgi:uncharacterized membrane protein
MLTSAVITQLALYILYILIPLLVLYFIYLMVTKAFNDMGFSSVEAIIIVFLSFLLGSGLLDAYIGIHFSAIPLFVYGNWMVGINTGGAIIPIVLSVYLAIKNRINTLRLFIGIAFVTVVTYFVTYPDPEKGIVSVFPFWLLPVVTASLASIILLWKEKQKAAPFAYICGTLGVLLGADFFHLWELLGMSIKVKTPAIIGGASVFDMVFLTGLLAVIFDGIVIYQERKKPND